MANYANGDVLMMERTEALDVPASVNAAVTIPTVDATGKTPIRPMYLEICESDGDFTYRVDNGSTAGSHIAVVAADLSVINRPLIPIGPDTSIKTTAGGARVVDVRWIYPGEARDGITQTIDHASLTPILTFALTGGTIAAAAAKTLTIPANAVEMVIQSISGGGATPGMRYAVAASGTPTAIIDVPAAMATHGAPYRIFLNDADALRYIRTGDTDQSVYGYFRMKA